SLVQARAAITFTSKTLAAAPASVPETGPYTGLIPVLLTRTSIRPQVSIVLATASVRCAGSSARPGTPTATPSPPSSPTASASGSGLRAGAQTPAPAAARRRAVAG